MPERVSLVEKLANVSHKQVRGSATGPKTNAILQQNSKIGSGSPPEVYSNLWPFLNMKIVVTKVLRKCRKVH